MLGRLTNVLYIYIYNPRLLLVEEPTASWDCLWFVVPFLHSEGPAAHLANQNRSNRPSSCGRRMPDNIGGSSNFRRGSTAVQLASVVTSFSREPHAGVSVVSYY